MPTFVTRLPPQQGPSALLCTRPSPASATRTQALTEPVRTLLTEPVRTFFTSFQKMKRVPLMMTEADSRIFRMRALLRIVSLTFLGGCRRVSLSTGSTPKLLGTKWNPLK